MIRIEIDTHEVTRALNRLLNHVDDMRPAFDDIGAALVTRILDGFDNSEDPWGQSWEDLARPRRRQGKGSGGDKPLMDTRQHIYQRITHNPDSHGVTIGMNENQPIGVTHQFGSPSKNIPARPFLPIRNNQVDLPSDWEREILGIIEKHLSA